MAKLLIAIVATVLAAHGEELQDYRFLGGTHPRFTGYEGYALRKIVPLAKLPPRIGFEPGKLSLVPDPTDATGIYMVVYLVNDTDQPVPRVVGENKDVDSQMMINGTWFPRDPLILGCGSVAAPTDLPPRHALALGARRPGLGNSDGVIRYAFPAADVFSNPMPGRYESAQVDQVLTYQTSSSALHEAFLVGCENGKWHAGEIARDPEDFAALLEIVRHHQLCVSEKRQIRDWILKQRQQPRIDDNLKKALDRMDEILWMAWIRHDDHQAVVNRCIAALEAPPPGEFGTPERCVGVVWRYLSFGEVARAVDRADTRSREKLLRLAHAAIAGRNLSARKGAALFLARRTAESEFPTAGFHEFLESGVTEICQAGLEGLKRRGRKAEAGPWMLRQPPDDPALCSYYEILKSSPRDKKPEWEAEIIKRLLDHHPLKALNIILNYSKEASDAFPSICEAPLRRALVKELEPARRVWWNEQAERTASEEFFPERYYPKGLQYGIWQLDQFGVSEDSGLFLAFLDHPAGEFSSNDGRTRYFNARAAAEAALLGRHIPLAGDVVTEFKLSPTGDVTQEQPARISSGWHATAGLYCLLGAASLIVGLRIRMIRTD